ncbi:MAG: hypothetical protein IT463_01510 [Planctomycetes bacterium]|nr:hypothetical protein [Planctomycetota bacterium]
MRLILPFLLLLLAPVLAANDLAVAAPDGHSGWLLLENPPGAAGDGLSPQAGDPGLPVPEPFSWPGGTYPQTDLWPYDARTSRFTRVTDVLAGDAARPGWRRTLYAVFEVRGEPFVLHYDAAKPGGNICHLLRANQCGAAAGTVPAAAVALASPEYLDAPAVSPDRSHVALRAFKVVAGKYQVSLRVYRTADWTLAAESAPGNLGRPVWLSNSALAVLRWKGDAAPKVDLAAVTAEVRKGNRINEEPACAPGTLLRLDLGQGALPETALLDGEFPPETFTRALAGDWCTGQVVLARRDGAGMVLERRPAQPNAAAFEIARMEHFRGVACVGTRMHAAGVVKGELTVFTLERWSEVRLPGCSALGLRPRRMVLPGVALERLVMEPALFLSPSGLGGMVDLGRGVLAMLQPAANAAFVPATPGNQPAVLHTISVLNWRLDSMQNPRNLARFSAMVRRFGELDAAHPGGIASTQFAFDVAVNDGQGNVKRGTYVEICHAEGRGGKGRIRTEDNLGGNWLVYSVDGDGTPAGDLVYSSDNLGQGAGKEVMDVKSAAGSKVYDDLVTQLEARRLLMLNNVAASPDNGGLRFMGHGTYRDPAVGTLWRVWVFEKLGRVLPDGQRERVELRFVSGLPGGTAGSWAFPHALVRAKLRFAMANKEGAALTDLAFAPDKWVALPNLTDPRQPPLLLPAQYRIFDGKQEKVSATLKTSVADYPKDIVATGKLESGYCVPVLGRSPLRKLREAADRFFRKQQR